jgi:uncharacterized membrane protein
MKDRVSHWIGVLKTTAIGGIFFLLPLVVIGALVAQGLQIVWGVALSIHEYLPIDSAVSYVLLFTISIFIILLLCFLAGMAAKRSFGRRFSDSIEKYLLMLFPRYAIFKEQLTGNIGGEVLRNQLLPVLVLVPEGQRLGMEVERQVVEGTEWVTVFSPGSPDPWSGSIVIVEGFRVTRIEVPFSEAIATVEQLGRGSIRLLAGKNMVLPAVV